MKYTQRDLLMEYYKLHHGRDVPHPEIVDWAAAEWLKRTGKRFRDPDRAIRLLADMGQLIKVKKGVYRYDPDIVAEWERQLFSEKQKEQIKKRDNYRCRFCGMGPAEGVEIHVDHIRSPQHGGKSEIDNGETLCARHNYMKKKLGALESGKRFFISLYDTARKVNDKSTFDFCREVLEVYEKHRINGHVKWQK